MEQIVVDRVTLYMIALVAAFACGFLFVFVCGGGLRDALWLWAQRRESHRQDRANWEFREKTRCSACGHLMREHADYYGKCAGCDCQMYRYWG